MIEFSIEKFTELLEEFIEDSIFYQNGDQSCRNPVEGYHCINCYTRSNSFCDKRSDVKHANDCLFIFAEKLLEHCRSEKVSKAEDFYKFRLETVKSIKAGDTIVGSDLQVGMVVRRYVSGKYLDDTAMIVYRNGPYYKNTLYSYDLFLVVSNDNSI